ncbi:hypothetical protein BOTBODRAFT_44628 [Botryobasidium botryosum FD-172 SS1]|uniref:Uncharacterized protein n=1 Tax=Botryobasidium botryosum (strain FD-172 SS1) TaxID=930990 RepID=A0A067MSI3_BOTB1|nr:hypothetical protein BOTBODRAFT_44628 [Botryobasidium botryosum FD-172 SS1]
MSTHNSSALGLSGALGPMSTEAVQHWVDIRDGGYALWFVGSRQEPGESRGTESSSNVSPSLSGEQSNEAMVFASADVEMHIVLPDGKHPKAACGIKLKSNSGGTLCKVLSHP